MLHYQGQVRALGDRRIHLHDTRMPQTDLDGDFLKESLPGFRCAANLGREDLNGHFLAQSDVSA